MSNPIPGDDANRAAFEAQFALRPVQKLRNPDGTYQVALICDRWTIWQAARAAGAPAETAKAVQRYDLECEERMGGWATENVMKENATCEWVCYEDLAAPQIDATTAPTGNDDLNEALASMFNKIGGTGPCPVQFPATAPDVAKDAARLAWLADRFTGYDFYWGGKAPYEDDEDKGKCVIVFEVGMDFKGGRDFKSAIDAQIAAMGALPPTGSEKGGA